MVTKTRQNGGAREAILVAATQLFSDKGYAGTTMRDIAKAVGVLPGSLYAHIDGKETLLLEIIQQGIAEFLDAVSAGLAEEGSADDKLRAMILAHVLVVAKQPQKTQIVFHQWRYLSDDKQRIVRVERAAYQALFRDVLESGVRDGTFGTDIDVRVTVLSILGALNWTPEWLSPDGPIPVEEIASRLSDSVLKGVLAR
jgi:AcrR family transcriptional regulator